MNRRIPSDIKLVHKTSSEILKNLRTLKIDKSALFDIRFAFEEALINAILHGNKNQKDLFVQIELNQSPEKIEITLQDQGEGFNPQAVADPTIPENLEKGFGRGVFLIHKLMDKVEYFNQGRGIRIIKYLKS